MENEYWFQNLNVLIDGDKLGEFIPKSWMSYPEKVNSLIRLSIYIGVVLMVFHKKYLYLYVPLIAMSGSFVLYLFRKASSNREESISEDEKKLQIEKQGVVPTGNDNVWNGKVVENMKNTSCTKPDVENPFMNYLPYDDRKKAKSCPPTKTIKNEIENDFNKGLFRDVGDIFNKSNGQRQFYTMPVTESSNNQKDFANWLYNTGPSCKEGDGRKCHNNNPARVQGSSSKYRHF